MEVFNNNDKYIRIAREILDIKRDFDFTDTDNLIFEVFQIYENLGYYIEEPNKDKDSEFYMTYHILRAGLGDTRYSTLPEYNIFKEN